MYQVSFSEDQRQIHLQLSNHKAPFVGRLFALFLCLLALLLPIIFFAFSRTGDETQQPLHFGFFIVFALTAGVSFYFLRLFLWNSFGKEHLVIKTNSLIHYFDYRWFESQKKSYDLPTAATNNSIVIQLNSSPNNWSAQKDAYPLTLRIENVEIKSTVQISTSEFQQLQDELTSRKV
jgi:hypothetical protein